MRTKLNQSGFHAVEAVIIILVIAVIGVVGWMVFSKTQNKDQAGGGDSNGYVAWSFNGSTWQPEGNAPACEEPVTVSSPIDASKATNVLYPGQIRGGDFKPHGGLGIENATSNQVDVNAMMDGYLYRGSRYIEGGQVQYMFDFINPCGIMYRYDHLATLTPEFQAYADQLPEPQVDDSRTTIFEEHPLIKRGTPVATAIGFSEPKVNAFFDVGVYDLRQPNAASKTALYQTDQQRIQDKEQANFSVCWFDWLTGEEKDTIKALKPRNMATENVSDYCEVSS